MSVGDRSSSSSVGGAQERGEQKAIVLSVIGNPFCHRLQHSTLPIPCHSTRPEDKVEEEDEAEEEERGSAGGTEAQLHIHKVIQSHFQLPFRFIFHLYSFHPSSG